MTRRMTINGLARRLFRKSLRWRLKRSGNGSGLSRMWGYCFSMKYPDAFRWASQVIEVFDEDCYRIARLPDSPRIVDVGANIGTFSAAVLWHRRDAKVIAIEPSPDNLEYLEHNLVGIRGENVLVMKVAAGLSRGLTRIGGAYSDSYRTGLDSGVLVNVIPLSEVLQGPADLLKIDVEGAELDALKGAAEGLSNVKRVAIEYHDYPGKVSMLPELLLFLKDAGFTALEVDGLRKFPLVSSDLPVACCLVHGWRPEVGCAR